MARIILIDDDYTSEILAETLRNLGHDVQNIRSTDEALQNIENVAACDLLVLDVIMPPPSSGTDISGGRTAGMAIYRNLRKVNAKVPILAYTASTDRDVLAVFERDAHTTFLGKWSAPSMKDLVSRIERALGIARQVELPRPFIVHGRDEATKLAVKNYLQNNLKFPEPIILHEQPSVGRTIIEKFEHYAGQSDLVIVLLTPDDVGAPAGATNDEKRRARQNVILELGFFLGALGRSSGRVFLLYKGPLELPSDLGGVCYIDISSGIEAASETIRKEIQHVLG